MLLYSLNCASLEQKMPKMNAAIKYREPAMIETFDEAAYLEANKDVAAAVGNGTVRSGAEHFSIIGHTENRLLSRRNEVMRAKKEKVQSIVHDLMKEEFIIGMHECGAINCLSEQLKIEAAVVDTAAVSMHDYDNVPQNFINKNPKAWILDAGAGLRPIYYPNVINFEVIPYDTTDVLGVGESLPFKDGSFDFVISSAVLEHVRDPFECAKELYRVLKPGRELFVAVPFLCPYHGYPRHYYNMTTHGVRNLFPPELETVHQSVPHYLLPLWAARHFFSLWASALSEPTREEFLGMPIRDFLQASTKDYAKPYISEMSEEIKNYLAYGTVLRGKKPKC
jgi:SAM-dependent methyltransferase